MVGWQLSAGSPVDAISVSATGLVFQRTTGRLLNGVNCMAIFDAKAPPGGFASGTVITATFSAAPNTVGDIAACSFTGLDGACEVISTSTGSGATAWTNTLTTLQPNDLVLAFTMIDTTTAAANAPSSGTEIHESWVTGRNRAIASEYLIATTPGSQTLSGTWSGNTGSTMNLTAAIAVRDVDVWIPPMPWMPILNPETGLPDIGWSLQISADLLVAPPAGLAIVTESDVVLELGRTKTKALPTVTETDSTPALVAVKARALTVVSEVDTILALGKTKVKALSVVTEADLARVISRSGQVVALATVSETDSVLTFGRKKSRSLAVISEADTVLTFGRKRSLAIVTEADSSIAFGRRKSRTFAVVTETDSVLAISGRKQKSVATVTEADTAVVLGRRKSRSASTVSETDTVLAYGKAKRKTLGTVTETDLALVITRFGTTTSVTGGQFAWISVF